MRPSARQQDQAAPHVAAGRLVRVREGWTAPFPGYFLYYPSRRQVLPALAAFVAALRRGRISLPQVQDAPARR